MKVSALGSTVEDIQAKLNKVFGEQQTAINALKEKVAALEQASKDADVPEEVVARIAEINALIQTVDDSIPDTEGTPA